MGEVYPIDLFYLTEQINKRHIDDYLMQLRIATNPHLEGEKARPLVENLMYQRKKLHGFVDEEAKLDVEGLEQLKKDLKQNSKTVMVK